MAKINLNQHNQENPTVLVTVASLGVLICMIVSILGIKLWWFKHRLSFEQTSTQNGAAGGTLPTVVVPRRNKKQKFKDKRWSQQISESVEVHGVFRQKTEDEFDIQRPQQLPPIRIRQLSESTQSLILPPPRSRGRQQQVHSTAFEELDMGTPIITPTPSTTVLNSTNESEITLSLTFEEFEKQFKLREIKPEIQEETTKVNEVNEIPIPPLRLNRSSSAMTKPEKTPRYLKSSQSITIPEFHKVIERRPTGFSKPTEDLTKIDDFEETQLFENFGERRPTGYIKYEEVDRDLSDRYEQELSQESFDMSKEKVVDYKFTDNGNWESSNNLLALEGLRNERIIYQNDLNESPDVINNMEQFSKSQYIDFNKDNFEINKNLPENKQEKTIHKDFSNAIVTDERRERREENTIHKDFLNSLESKDLVTDKSLMLSDQFDDHNYKSVKDRRPTEFVRSVSNEISDDYENQFEYWPQFEEKIETPKVNVRKFEHHNFETQTSVEDEEDTDGQMISIDLKESKDEENSFAQQRTITGHTRNWEERFNESPDLSEIENFEKENEQSNLKQKKLYSQLRSLITEESPTKTDVRFEFAEVDNSETEHYENTALKQRRPTGFVRDVKEEETERSVTFNSETEDYENYMLKQRRPTGYVKNDKDEPEDFENSPVNQRRPNEKEKEIVTEQSVSFDTESSEFEYFSTKQRRPTGYVRNGQEEPDTERSVTFNTTSEDYGNSPTIQRRPTGYVRNEIEELETEQSDDFEYFSTKQRRPTGYVRNDQEESGNERSFNLNSKLEDYENSSIKQTRSTDNEKKEISSISQRRPTGYIRDTDFGDDDSESRQHKVKFENTGWPDNDSSENYSLNQRRPTGFIRNDGSYSEYFDEDCEIVINEITKTKVTFSKNIHDSEEDTKIWLGKQRRPTGYIKKSEGLMVEDFTDTKVKFAESTDFKESDHESSKLNQRRPTGFNKNPYKDYNASEDLTNDILKSEANSDMKVKFSESTDFKESENQFEIYPRRPTGFPTNFYTNSNETEVGMNFENPTVRFKDIDPNDFEDSEETNNALKNQRRATGFVTTPDIEKLFGNTKQVNFNNLPEARQENDYTNEALRQRRPTGFVRQTDIENSPTSVQPPSFHTPTSWLENEKKSEEIDPLWQEMEKDLAENFNQNLDEEFSKIRHSYEINEGDFLELKEELQKSSKPLGFGKTIEDDWENFEKLKTTKIQKLQEDDTEIQITYNEEELNTTSILKDTQLLEQQDIQPKPRKSKVTFDFKTEEHLIPARSNITDSEEDDYYEDYSDFDDDVYNKPAPPIPPEPMQRLSTMKYTMETSTSSSLYTPVVAIPTSISLFGSQISKEDDNDAAEDSWSAIRKHRNLTEEFHNLSLRSPNSPPPSSSSLSTSPPKPAYRNPLAQLAIQRAKEVKSDMEGFKSRSINDRKPEASKRNQQRMLNLHKEDFEDTEA